MDIVIETGERQLTDDERRELAAELPRVRIELKRRFGEVSCPEHGEGPEAAVIDVSEFPSVTISFRGFCCEALDRALTEAARS